MTAQPREPLTPQLEGFLREFEGVRVNALELVGDLPEKDFHTRPAPGKWSVAECLAHLNATARQYQPVIQRAAGWGHSRGHYGQGPFGYGLLGKLAVWILEPPPRVRLPAPGVFRPVDHGSKNGVVEEFLGAREKYTECLWMANGLDLGRVKIASPTSPRVKVNLAGGFAFLAAHERRHLWQARRVKDRLGGAGRR